MWVRVQAGVWVELCGWLLLGGDARRAAVGGDAGRDEGEWVSVMSYCLCPAEKDEFNTEWAALRSGCEVKMACGECRGNRCPAEEQSAVMWVATESMWAATESMWAATESMWAATASCVSGA